MTLPSLRLIVKMHVPKMDLFCLLKKDPALSTQEYNPKNNTSPDIFPENIQDLYQKVFNYNLQLLVL